jgi:hypothetical protein
VAFVLILVSAFAAEGWALLAMSRLVTVVPMMLIVIWALRLPDDTGRAARGDGAGDGSSAPPAARGGDGRRSQGAAITSCRPRVDCVRGSRSPPV